MSIACGIPILECVYCLACVRPLGLEALPLNASHDSETWGLASVDEFEPIPRLCRYILANYEDDLEIPRLGLPSGCPVDPTMVVSRKKYRDTCGRAPPYLVYLDHQYSDSMLAVRDLNLAKDNELA